ncbi:unnamed protein product [Penicillium manginii]
MLLINCNNWSILPAEWDKTEDENGWQADNIGLKLELAKYHPIMFPSTELMYMFEAGEKFRYWYFIRLTVFKITFPTNMDNMDDKYQDIKAKEDALKIPQKIIERIGSMSAFGGPVSGCSSPNYPSIQNAIKTVTD